ncbi:MAG: hypothetical protein QOD51_2920 [Candidatus Eremiobacteraeota bacterium]|jgi:hypothetical protein|nr:hypothetical protein [Candidatus Eremiobacteraeota bacterium]
MPGVRRTAVLATAFLLLSAAWATAEAPRQHVLPAGTAVVFVTDAPLDAGRREGDVVAVHLRYDLVLDGTVIAPAGTHAQLLVGGVTGPDGRRRPAVSLDRFTINAGLMPVKSVEPLVPPVPAGAQIDALTLAEVDHIGDRWSIRIPFPFQLSGDQPASAYTPTPARTAPAKTMMRPDPKATATPPPTAAPSATSVPEPVPTKIPGG